MLFAEDLILYKLVNMEIIRKKSGIASRKLKKQSNLETSGLGINAIETVMSEHHDSS